MQHQLRSSAQNIVRASFLALFFFPLAWLPLPEWLQLLVSSYFSSQKSNTSVLKSKTPSRFFLTRHQIEITTFINLSLLDIRMNTNSITASPCKLDGRQKGLFSQDVSSIPNSQSCLKNSGSSFSRKCREPPLIFHTGTAIRN